MIIDVFKTGLFEPLKPFNDDIIAILDAVCIQGEDGEYYYRAEPERRISRWFDPSKQKTLPFPRHWPNTIPANDDPKYCLLENYPSYASIFVINELYGDNKDVMIEDVCCGQAKFAFFLSKLGFKNFSLIENFSELRPEFLIATMAAGGITYKLNAPTEDVKPVIMNHVAYPSLVREITPSIELLCVYNNERAVKVADELTNFKWVAIDTDGLLSVYARLDKYDLFHSKLAKYEVLRPNK